MWIINNIILTISHNTRTYLLIFLIMLTMNELWNNIQYYTIIKLKCLVKESLTRMYPIIIDDKIHYIVLRFYIIL